MLRDKLDCGKPGSSGCSFEESNLPFVSTLIIDSSELKMQEINKNKMSSPLSQLKGAINFSKSETEMRESRGHT